MSHAPSSSRTGALVAALERGRPGFAAVDVYEQEPIIGGDHPFLKMPNVLCMPHLGWTDWETFELYFRECFEQIVNYAEGKAAQAGELGHDPFRLKHLRFSLPPGLTPRVHE